MAINLTDNIQSNNPYGLDNRTGKRVAGEWEYFTSVAEANAANDITYRHKGLVIPIKIGAGEPVDYHYKNGKADGDLVVKATAGDAAAIFGLIDNEDDNATVIGTLVGDKIVFALNSKLNVPGGLVTYEYLTENYVTNDAFQEALAAVYTAIAAGGGPAEMPLDIFTYYADFRSGVTLVGSDIDAVADQSSNGNNLIAASALLRPAYDATGWGGQPCAVFTGSQSLYIPNLDLSGTQDVTFFALLKRENGSIGVVVEHTADGPNLPTTTGFGVYTNDGALNVSSVLLGDQGTGQAGGLYDTGRLRAQFWKSTTVPEVKIFDNGTELLDQVALPGTDNTNFFSAGPHFIGSRNNAGAFLVGKIAAIGLVPRKTTAVENAKIASALLASFPTNP